MPREDSPLRVVGDSGLYCPAGDFHVDPWRPVPHALITHGHGDHLRSGNGRYWLAAPGLGIARRRMGAEATIEAVPYREPLRFGQTTVSWHPAGLVLGSAQLRIEHEGRVWVVSGDYQRDPDPTCEPFEPLPCDVFISEATFALPVYRGPPAAQVVGDIHAWWQENRERGHWWKWKIDPWSFDAVMLYAQPGSGRRSSLYTDYTFGARHSAGGPAGRLGRSVYRERAVGDRLRRTLEPFKRRRLVWRGGLNVLSASAWRDIFLRSAKSPWAWKAGSIS